MIIPYFLEKGLVAPLKARIVEGKDMLDRAQKALDLLRERQVSGERLVWKIHD